MLKKRLIFTLIYDSGQFMLSRNFRLQYVGDIDWLKNNYDFSQISCSIDELIVLDVTRANRNIDKFCDDLKIIVDGCYVPVSAGGGIKDVQSVKKLLRSGADKVVINSLLYEKSNILNELASEYGQQCIVASMDLKVNANDKYNAWSNNGTICEPNNAEYWISKTMQEPVGEIYLNSIDKDGTGQGFDLNILELLPNIVTKPIILAGGAGNSNHLFEGLSNRTVDAVATANLFNFVGNGLKKARHELVSRDIILPIWDTSKSQNSIIFENT